LALLPFSLKQPEKNVFVVAEHVLSCSSPARPDHEKARVEDSVHTIILCVGRRNGSETGRNCTFASTLMDDEEGEGQSTTRLRVMTSWVGLAVRSALCKQVAGNDCRLMMYNNERLPTVSATLDRLSHTKETSCLFRITSGPQIARECCNA
jgi:hypothetical protein